MESSIVKKCPQEIPHSIFFLQFPFSKFQRYYFYSYHHFVYVHFTNLSSRISNLKIKIIKTFLIRCNQKRGRNSLQISNYKIKYSSGHTKRNLYLVIDFIHENFLSTQHTVYISITRYSYVYFFSAYLLWYLPLKGY